ncbi:MAG TPA: VanZ family protein [Longimicrobiales bacterium]|nr:VanZ family protein [Longimicrobiales bacterium]
MKRVGLWLAMLGVAAISVATLTPVPGAGGGGTSQVCLICHQRGVADFISNIILFAPLGVGLALRRVSLLRVAAIAFGFSLTIELLQLQVIAGRDSNVGDLAANSLGGIVGWWLGRTLGWWLPRADGALRRSLALALTAIAVLLGGLSLLVPAPPTITYFMQWTADLGGLAHYQGEVLESRLGAVELRGAMRVDPDSAFRALLMEPEWNVRFVAGEAPPSLAPIVSIYDGLQREVVLLGAQRDNVVYRQRLRAGELRFDEPDLRGYAMLEGIAPGDTASLGFRADRAEVCVQVNARSRCTHGYTIGDTWALVMFPDVWGRVMRTIMSVAWLFAVFFPAGFVAHGRVPLAAAGVLVVTALLAGPVLLGFALTPFWQVAAAVLGLGAGYAGGQLALRQHARFDRARAHATS